MEWWGVVPLFWWAGMIPAAAIAGSLQRQRRAAKLEPHADQAVIIFVLAWPLCLLFAPILGAHLWAQRQKRGRDGDAQ